MERDAANQWWRYSQNSPAPAPPKFYIDGAPNLHSIDHPRSQTRLGRLAERHDSGLAPRDPHRGSHRKHTFSVNASNAWTTSTCCRMLPVEILAHSQSVRQQPRRLSLLGCGSLSRTEDILLRPDTDNDDTGSAPSVTFRRTMLAGVLMVALTAIPPEQR